MSFHSWVVLVLMLPYLLFSIRSISAFTILTLMSFHSWVVLVLMIQYQCVLYDQYWPLQFSPKCHSIVKLWWCWCYLTCCVLYDQYRPLQFSSKCLSIVELYWCWWYYQCVLSDQYWPLLFWEYTSNRKPVYALG